jgi:hypothetical protein
VIDVLQAAGFNGHSQLSNHAPDVRQQRHVPGRSNAGRVLYQYTVQLLFLQLLLQLVRTHQL